MATLIRRLERFFTFDLTTVACSQCVEAIEAIRTGLAAKTPGDRVLKAKLDYALALSKCDGVHEVASPKAANRSVRSLDVNRAVAVRCVHKDLVPLRDPQDGRKFVKDENGDKVMTYKRCDVIIEGTALQMAECKSLCPTHAK